MSKQSNHRFCVVTYNLLSPAYVKPTYFPGIEKIHLDDEQRLKRTYKLLQKWINVKAIICLQELCEQWMQRFEKIFKDNNYRFDYTMGAEH